MFVPAQELSWEKGLSKTQHWSVREQYLNPPWSTVSAFAAFSNYLKRKIKRCYRTILEKILGNKKETGFFTSGLFQVNQEIIDNRNSDLK